MRVSLINVELVAEDAIGSCIVHQVRFFFRRGDDVQVYVEGISPRLPEDVRKVVRVTRLRELIEGKHEHFRLSDLYVYHYPGRYPLVESIRGIERGTVVFYYHNVTPPELWGSEWGRDMLMRGIEGGALVHYADACITDSPFNKRGLVERYDYPAERIHVLPLAVALDEFSPGEKDPDLVRRYDLEGQYVLLYVGRMAGNKRIDLLVEALAHIRREVPNTRLLLVGDDQSNPALRQVVAAAREKARELGVLPYVTWAGRVADLPRHYRLADVYVTASVHEGFGVPLIEAMACGVPIVAARAGAMPWVLGDAGLMAEPGDSFDLATKIVSVLRDARLHQELVQHGLARAKDFGLARYQASLSEFIERAVTYTLPDITSAEERGKGTLLPGELYREHVILQALAEEAYESSDVALRDYAVRSGVPLFGPLIAWIRRNLTSHLREPYLDPIVERQVSFNQRAADWMRRLMRAWGSSARRQDELEAQIKTFEERVKRLETLLGEDEQQAR